MNPNQDSNSWRACFSVSSVLKGVKGVSGRSVGIKTVVREEALSCGSGNLTRLDTLAWHIGKASQFPGDYAWRISSFVASVSTTTAGTRSLLVHSRPSTKVVKRMDG